MRPTTAWLPRSLAAPGGCPVAGASVIVAITCPICGGSTRASTGWVRSCGGVFCQGCTELILLDGALFASACEALDEAVRELDELLGELRKPLAQVARF